MTDKKTPTKVEDPIRYWSQRFEEARETVETLKQQEITGKIGERIEARYRFAKAEADMKIASKKLGEAINQTVEDA